MVRGFLPPLGLTPFLVQVTHPQRKVVYVSRSVLTWPGCVVEDGVALAVMVLCFAATSMSCLETRSRFASTMASCIPKKVLPAGALPTPSHLLVAGAGRVALRVHNSAPTARSATTSVRATMPLFFQLNGYGSNLPLYVGLT